MGGGARHGCNSTFLADEGTCVSLISLSQLCHQGVAISLLHLHKEIRGAIERDMMVFGTFTSGMTTGVGGIGDSLLRHARYFQSLLTKSVVPVVVAPLAAYLSEEMHEVCLVARAMCIRVVNTPGDVNIQCAGALFDHFAV